MRFSEGTGRGLTGRRRGPGRDRGLLAITVAWLAVVALPAMTLAAGPSESPGGAAGDPRSSGQGPGLVGDPAGRSRSRS